MELFMLLFGVVISGAGIFFKINSAVDEGNHLITIGQIWMVSSIIINSLS